MVDEEEFIVPHKPDDLLNASGSYSVEEIELDDALHALDGGRGPRRARIIVW
jgi:hypothetical protein